MFYLRGEELLVHSNCCCCCCCCTASATATLCFAFTHTHTHTPSLARSHTPPHTHLLTHALSVFSFNPPSLPVSPLLSLCWSLPPFIICCLLYIPLSAQAFPSLSQHLLASLWEQSKPVLNYFSPNSAFTCSSQLLRVFPISVSSSTCSECLFWVIASSSSV